MEKEPVVVYCLFVVAVFQTQSIGWLYLQVDYYGYGYHSYGYSDGYRRHNWHGANG